VGFFVRPGEPRGGVRLPFGGHPVAERKGGRKFAGGALHSFHRLRIGEYASMRRSRRKGQLRRVSSVILGSHSTMRISSLSAEPSRRTRPNGSETKECPQNSRPL